MLYIDVLMVFDKPVKVQYLYASVNKEKINLKSNPDMEKHVFKGMFNSKVEYSITTKVSSGKWTKITPKQAPITAIQLSKDYIYDDISILYDSDYDVDGDIQRNGLYSMLEQVIDELVENGEDDF